MRVSWVVFPELQGDTLMQVITAKAGHRVARVQRIVGRHFARRQRPLLLSESARRRQAGGGGMLPQPGHVVCQRRFRKLRGGDVVTASLESLNNRAPARSIGPSAVY